MFVYTSGKIDNFCSSKCEKHVLKLKRKALRTRWTEAYRKEHKKVNKDKKVNKEEKR
jgi:ribosomal protein L24E